MTDAAHWDEKYAATELLWSAGPNIWVEQLLGSAEPGRIVDIAAGEGRNAVWLAERGWDVVALDYSPVAIERVKTIAARRLGTADRLEALVADATQPLPLTEPVDVALYCYLQLPHPELRMALRHGLDQVKPSGTVIVIGHSLRNLAEGFGGPRDPGVLYDPEQLLELIDCPVEVVRSEIVVREVDTEDGPRQALDTLVVLRRTP